MNKQLLIKGTVLPMTLFCSALVAAPFLGVSDAKASTAVVQQTGTVKGTILDSNGEPVIGASILVVGQKGQGAVSDMDGHFVLNVKPGTKLKITYIGFETQTVSAKNGMVVTLKDDNATSLNAVEVVAYGAQKKVTVTGAIASVKSEELTRTPVSSVSQVLAGQLTGVTTVQSSGEPGADNATIYVRGQGTFNDPTPLIQVDGVERSMNDIDPEEIESITVLKDASATAVFGVRGANGVILITTKRGEEGKAKISASTSFSILEPTKMVELANSYDYAMYHNMQNRYDGTKEQFSPEIIQKFQDHSDPVRFPDTNWIDYVMKKSTIQTKHNVNISGGAKGVRYFISAGMYTQGGLFKEFDMDKNFGYEYTRFNYRSNLDIDVTKTTKLSINIAGNHSSKDSPYSSLTSSGLVRNLYEATPFSSPGLVDGKFIRTTTTYLDCQLPFTGGNGMTYYNYDGTRGGYTNVAQNVLQMDLQLSQKLDFITKGLSFKIKGSYNSSYSVTKNGSISMAYYTPILMDDGSLNYLKVGTNGTSWGYSKSQGKARNWYAEAALNYSRSFGLHNVTGLVLFNQSKTYYYSTQYPDIPRGYMGLVARATYNWNNRYMAEFNVGYNGSENFAPKKRFGTFPAFSAGWVASEESWFKALKPTVSFLKLRASWGLVGNDKYSGNRFMYIPDSYSTSSGAYRFGIDNANRLSGAAESAKKNPDVTWEKAFKQDYGFDIRFLGDRLQLNYDYYFERRKDILLTDYTIPATLMGITLPPANKGKMNSWGHEISVKWQDKLTQNGRYWVGLNLSYNQNKIIENKEAYKVNEYQYLKGHRRGTRSLYKFWKFYYEGCEADYEKEFGKPFPTQTLAGDLRPGDCVFIDLDGDGKVDANDASYDGTKSDDPKWVAGLNLGFSWKDFSVNTQWTGAWDVSRLIAGVFRQPFVSQTGAKEGGLTQYLVDHTWTEENPSQDSWYPRPTWKNDRQNYADCTLYEKDSKYLRLKTLQISYNMHFPFMKVVGLRSAKLSLSGYNLLTLTPYKFGDPEATASREPSYPLQRTYTATLQLNF